MICIKTEKNIFTAFILNLSFSVFEFFGGLFTNSIAILSDSIHDLGDAISIGLSYFLEKRSKKKPNYKYTYGYIRYSVMGSLITTMILLIGSAFVIYESVKRIINPVVINHDGMLLFAIFGVIVNLIAANKTKEGTSLNQKAVNLHMLEDVFGWIIVLIGSLLIKFTEITYVDPILSILVALFIMYNVIKNLKSIVDIFLEKTPDDIDIKEIKKHLQEVEGVIDIHHIHVRSIDGFNNFATLHAVIEKYDQTIKVELKKELREHNIMHSTIELELKDEKCAETKCKIDNVKTESHHHH